MVVFQKLSSFFAPIQGDLGVAAAIKEVCKSVFAGLTTAFGWMAAKAGAGAIVPLVMSWTGTVVKGLGTLHKAGSLTAMLQAFSTGSLGPSIWAVVGVGVAAYWACKCILYFT
jgi:hypothetical protein